MPLIELTPENIKNNKYEGVFINRINKDKALENLEKRFEDIKFIAQHNIILATKCIITCFLPQRQERIFLKSLAVQQIQEYQQPDLSATSFIALAKLEAWYEVTEQYHLLKNLKKEQKQKLTPAYLQYLKYNGFEKEQSLLFTMLINLATSFEEAERFFYAMEMQHIIPNNHSYTSVMNKANDWEDAQFWLQKAIFDGFEANEVSYNILIHLSKDFGQAKNLLAEMYEKGLKPNEITYNSLINLSKDFEKAKNILAEMYEKGLKPDEFNYNSLINMSKDFGQAKNLLAEMYEKGLKPNEFNYNSLINMSKDFEKAKNLLAEMYEKGLKPDEITYNSLINMSKDFGQAKNLLAEMYEKGLKPDEVTYNSLILNKINNISELTELFEEMQKFTSSLEKEAYNSFLSKIISLNINPKMLEIKNNLWRDSMEKLCMDWAYFYPKAVCVGDKISCEVQKIEKNRIIVKVKDELRRCTIHISELNWEVKNLFHEVKIGQVFNNARVIQTHPIYGVGLSLKPFFELKIDSVVLCQVIGFNDRNTSIYVKIEGTTQKASIFIKELTWQSRDLRQEVKIGQTFQAKVIGINEKYGVQLSLK